MRGACGSDPYSTDELPAGFGGGEIEIHFAAVRRSTRGGPSLELAATVDGVRASWDDANAQQVRTSAVLRVP
jgi:hypothetical protein